MIPQNLPGRNRTWTKTRILPGRRKIRLFSIRILSRRSLLRSRRRKLLRRFPRKPSRNLRKRRLRSPLPIGAWAPDGRNPPLPIPPMCCTGALRNRPSPTSGCPGRRRKLPAGRKKRRRVCKFLKKNESFSS